MSALRSLFLFLLCSLSLLAQPPRFLIQPVAGPGDLGEDAPALQTHLRYVYGLDADKDGNVYFSDYYSQMIRVLGSNGRVRTIAGLGIPGFSADGTLAREAYLQYPTDIRLAPDGTLYFIESSRIRKIDGNGRLASVAGNVNGSNPAGSEGVSALQVILSSPRGLSFGKDGSLYFVEYSGHRARRITPDGIIRTVAGIGTSGYDGDNKPAVLSRLNWPYDLAVDAGNSVYIADYQNQRIRLVTPDGNISTFAGTGTAAASSAGVQAAASPLFYPRRLWLSSEGSLYFNESTGSRISVVGPDRLIRRFAGSGISGYQGDGGPATSASFASIEGFLLAPSGEFLIADYGNARLRAVGKDGIVRTAAGGDATRFRDDARALQTPFSLFVTAVADPSGNPIVYDSRRYQLFRVSPQGTIKLLAGNGLCCVPTAGSTATNTSFGADSLATTPDGDVFFGVSSRVYKLTSGGGLQHIAGSGTWGDLGDGGPALAAQFNWAAQLAWDEKRKILYLLDTNTRRVRRILPSGIIEAVKAQLDYPRSIAVDPDGNLHIADDTRRIHRIAPDGTQSTFAGSGACCTPQDGARALESRVGYVYSMSFDRTGDLYFTESSGGVWLLNKDGIVYRVAGGGGRYNANGILATAASFYIIPSLATDGLGNVLLTSPTVLWRLTPAPQIACTHQIDKDSFDAPAAGGNYTVAVTASQEGCQWAPSTGFSWLTLSSADSWRSGVLTIRVAANTTTSARTGTITVAGRTVTVKQAGAVPTGPALQATAAIFNAASGLPAIAPGSWFTLKGERFAFIAEGRIWRADEIVSNRLPTQLEGVRVTVNRKPAAIYYVSPTQINAQAPDDTATGEVLVEISTNQGTAAGRLLLAPIAPGLFVGYRDESQNKNYPAAMVANSYTYVGPAEIFAAVGGRPAKPGEYISLYGTGFGPTNPVRAAGIVVAAAPLTNRVTATLAGQECEVQYAGLISAGLNQINIKVPDDTPDGEHELVLTVAGQITQTRVFLVVQR